MNSKQGTQYIKNRMGNDLKEKILQYNGIISENAIKKKTSNIDCPRCELVNAIENKYCSKCSYPLKPEAYDEIKQEENKKIQELESRHKKEMQNIREEIEKKFSVILEKIEIKNLV